MKKIAGFLKKVSHTDKNEFNSMFEDMITDGETGVPVLQKKRPPLPDRVKIQKTPVKRKSPPGHSDERVPESKFKTKMRTNTLFDIANIFVKPHSRSSGEGFNRKDYKQSFEKRTSEEKEEYIEEQNQGRLFLTKEIKKRQSTIPKYRIFSKVLFPRGRKNVRILPSKVFSVVFTFLDPKSLKCIFLTCKFWYNVTNTQKFWNNYFTNFFGHEDYFNFSREKQNHKHLKNHFVEQFLRYEYCMTNINFKATSCAFLGDTCVGKTTFLNILLKGIIRRKHMSTLGAIVSHYTLENYGQEVFLKIWDVGSKQYLKTAHLYYKDADIVILFYDLTSQESFDVMKTIFRDLVHRKYQNGEEHDVVLIGTKLDGERAVDLGLTINFLDEHPEVSYFEISNLWLNKWRMEKFFRTILFKVVEKRLFS